MSIRCFNCKKDIPEKEFYKHELECYSRFQENEMENLIPCERCNELISFEEYQNHINFCGYRTPIFYIPLIPTNSNQTSELEENEESSDSEPPEAPEGPELPEELEYEENIEIEDNINPIINTSPTVTSYQDNINQLINHHNILNNLLNSLNPGQINDDYEELSLLDNNNITKGVDIEKISKEVKLEEENDCSICFDKFKIFKEIRCGHMICIDCSKEWFSENNKCPICMTEFDEN